MKKSKSKLVRLDINYLFLICSLAMPGTILSQKTIEAIPGYKEILQIRFQSEMEWNGKREQMLNALVDVVLKLRKDHNQIIPLEYIQNNGDSIVNFYFSNDLKKLHKKSPILFTSDSELLVRSFASMRKPINEPRFNYDSIYHSVMEVNMLINSQKFAIDRYLDGSEISATCYFPKTQPERLNLIYIFFKNGILLGEDTYSGRLYYKPY